MVNSGWPIVYEGLGSTIELAIESAHSKIPIREGFDYVACRLLESGYQRGGFTDSKLFYARVVEDLGPFKT
jgi:hypothetical protein